MIKKAGGIVVDGKKVFLVSKDGLLQLSKGHIEDGEKIDVCARRETSEETGFNDLIFLIKEPIINEYQFTNKSGERKQVKLYIYLFNSKSKKQKKTVWMTAERLKGDWFDIDQAIKTTQLENVKEILKEAKKRMIQL